MKFASLLGVVDLIGVSECAIYQRSEPMGTEPNTGRDQAHFEQQHSQRTVAQEQH